MKKLFTIFACASLAFTLSAQDSNQPKGSWYLGSGDAKELLNIFSTGVTLSPTISYAVIDNLVLSANFSNMTESQEYDGSTYTESMTYTGVSAAYFFGDNFYAGAGVGMLTLSETGDEDVNGLAINIGIGKYIPLWNNLYLTPNFSYSTSTLDYNGSVVDTETDSGYEFAIGVGARF